MYKYVELEAVGKVKGTKGIFFKEEVTVKYGEEFEPMIIKEKDFEKLIFKAKLGIKEKMNGFVKKRRLGKYKLDKNAIVSVEVILIKYTDIDLPPEIAKQVQDIKIY